MNRIIIAAFLLALPISATAQGIAGSTDLRAGARIKIRTSSIHAAVGTVAPSGADSVALLTEGTGARLAVARSDITQMYASQGRTGMAGLKKGLLWGAALGAFGALGASIDPCGNSSAGSKCDSNPYGASRSQIALQTFVGSIVIGGGIGYAVGAEEWKELPVTPRLTLTPRSVGVAVGFSF